VTVTRSSGYDGMGAITVKYGGSLIAPTDTGTYAVTVDVVEDNNFFAATGLWLGTLTIGKATPTLEHLQYALPYTVVYDGSPHSVSVTPKPGCSGMGDIAVKYNGLPTAPINAGTYAITVDVAGGASFGSATGFALGTLTISKATPKAEHLDYSLTGATYDGATHGIALPTLKSAYSGIGDVTVKYGGSPTAPTNAGEYDVTVDVVGGANFLTATGLSLGKLTISKATPKAEHLSYTLPATVTYDGKPQSVAVGLKSDYSNVGAVTVKYDGSPTAPTNAGEYDITVDVDEGANFLSATGLLLGKLTIEQNEASSTVTVTFFANGGSRVASQSVPKGNKVMRPKDPEKSGYIFGGWYNYDFTSPWNFSSEVVTDDIVLYARWISDTIAIYAVSFESGGGSHIDSQIVETGNLIKRPADPVKAGEQFVGWYVDAAFTVLWNFPSDVVTESMTLYAKWIAGNAIAHAVTFNSNGGSNIDRQLVASGDAVFYPTNPVKDGYVFAGWYKDNDLSSRWNFSSDLVFDSLTLYAKWKAKGFLMNDLVINGVAQEVTGDTIHYTMPCGADDQEMLISFTITDNTSSAMIVDTLCISAVNLFQRDTLIEIPFGGQTERYVLKLEKRLDFNSIVRVHLNKRLLVVIRNPENNGGFDFQEVRWQRKDGQRWIEVAGGNKFYYTSPTGEVILDTMRVMLRDADGQWLSTCPYSVGEPDAPDVALRTAVYPNPVAAGGVIHLTKEFLTALNNDPEERYSTLMLLNVQGNVVYAGKASDLKQGLTMPLMPGIYHLLLEGKAGRVLFKVAVN
jgi:uncharacterized repeat protein (TIGR02543 family)